MIVKGTWQVLVNKRQVMTKNCFGKMLLTSSYFEMLTSFKLPYEYRVLCMFCLIQIWLGHSGDKAIQPGCKNIARWKTSETCV